VADYNLDLNPNHTLHPLLSLRGLVEQFRASQELVPLVRSQ
jgi:hypothetical protein